MIGTMTVTMVGAMIGTMTATMTATTVGTMVGTMMERWWDDDGKRGNASPDKETITNQTD